MQHHFLHENTFTAVLAAAVAKEEIRKTVNQRRTKAIERRERKQSGQKRIAWSGQQLLASKGENKKQKMKNKENVAIEKDEEDKGANWEVESRVESSMSGVFSQVQCAQ